MKNTVRLRMLRVLHENRSLASGCQSFISVGFYPSGEILRSDQNNGKWCKLVVINGRWPCGAKLGHNIINYYEYITL